jgi:anti-sigma B factor antagonist
MPIDPPPAPRFRAFHIDERHVDGATVLVVSGTVDMATAPELTRRVGTALRAAPRELVLDLTEVDFLATAGMSVIMEAHRVRGDADLPMRVVARGPATVRPMQLLGIDGLLDLHPTVESALAPEAQTAPDES